MIGRIMECDGNDIIDQIEIRFYEKEINNNN